MKRIKAHAAFVPMLILRLARTCTILIAYCWVSLDGHRSHDRPSIVDLTRHCLPNAVFIQHWNLFHSRSSCAEFDISIE